MPYALKAMERFKVVLTINKFNFTSTHQIKNLTNF